MNQPTKTNNSEVARHLNTQPDAKVNAGTAFEERAKNWFQSNGKRLRMLLGSDEDARRMFTAALNALSKTPTLIECSFQSFASCLLQSAEYRLYPGAAGECAYLPFKNHGRMEATFVIQYQGVCQLLYRSGMVKDIEGGVVCERDYFNYVRGSNRKLEFEPFDGPLDQRGQWLGVYCIIRNIFGGEHIIYMTAQEVDSIKSRSPASRSDFSPWNSKHASDRQWMWLKTALKQAAKLAPRSTKESAVVMAALESDEAAEPLSAGAISAMAHNPPEEEGSNEPHEGAAPAQRTIDAPHTAVEMPSRAAAEKVSARST